MNDKKSKIRMRNDTANKTQAAALCAGGCLAASHKLVERPEVANFAFCTISRSYASTNGQLKTKSYFCYYDFGYYQIKNKKI